MKALTVRELVGFLKTMNQNALVGLSSDSEGNSFSLVADDSFCVDKAYLKNELGTQYTYFVEENISIAKYGKVDDGFGNQAKISQLKECIILFGSN